MKISLEWLGSFVRLKDNDPAAIADRLTLAVAEVEEIIGEGTLLENCCVGKVLTIRKHPNADRLTVVEVETDRGKKRVVCGGSNVREGMLVTFAHVGATVRWHGQEMMTLEPVSIRGEASEGMICAAEELDLTDRFPMKGKHEIIDLSSEVRSPLSEVRVGQSLKEVLGSDTILDISNTAITHRADLFSHIGFAREFVAAGLAIWKEKSEPARKLPKMPTTSAPFSVEINDENLIPRYLACMLQVEGLGTTPEWMKKRLESVGVRPINLPVDITNYVMLEEGSPLHAFDAGKIRGTSIRFRAAEKGETVTTLDGVKRSLPDGAIILEDEEGIFDLCGLMGDLRTATTDSSRTFFLHAPVFDPVRTRKTIQAVGLRSDASTIFEKGVPHIAATRGFARALELFLELAPGAHITSKLIQWGTDGKAKSITIDSSRMQSILGSNVSAVEASKILEALGCTVKSKKKPATSNRVKRHVPPRGFTGQLTSNLLTVTPPTHRLRDLTTEMDILEEISRLHGYNRIHPSMPSAELRIPARDQRLHKLRDALKEEGFTEIVPLSLLGASLLKKVELNPADALAVQSPITEDTSLLQPSTLPGLLEHAERNLLEVTDGVKTFHWGHVFGKKMPEHNELSALLASVHETGTPTDPFLELKRSMSFALGQAGYELSIQPLLNPPAYAHPGRSASIVVQGQTIGQIFEVHPTVRSHFDLSHRAAAVTMDLDALWKLEPMKRMAKPVPHFPAIIYDFTITRTHAQPFGQLLTKLRKSDPLLEQIDVHDLYAGEPLKDGEYNVTLRCVYRSPERTLTEVETKKVHEKVVALASA